jgi:hypothetical protein
MITKIYLQILMLQFALILSSTYTAAQTSIVIPLGTAPVFDGSVGASEWIDADSLFINTAAGDVKVLYKHDCLNLNIVFVGNLESANINFPEVLIDVNNDKPTAWESDDSWFHVSATDCNFQGGYADYSNCAMVQSDWIGIPNISTGAPITDTIEIQIPLSTAGILSPTDTIGIAFAVTNTFSIWELWPATASTSSPATWGTATFGGCMTGIHEALEIDFHVYPNPVSNHLNIEFNSLQYCRLEIYNSIGEFIYNQTINAKSSEIDLSKFANEIYFLKVISNDGIAIKKILKTN